jgi:hypothetical protein
MGAAGTRRQVYLATKSLILGIREAAAGGGRAVPRNAR